MSAVLVVVAHADDEVLGCGGTIARHAAMGDQVHVVFVADGVTARRGAGSKELGERQSATEKACAILGVGSTTFLGLPDNRLDSVPLLNVIQPIEEICAKLAPQVVYTHHCGDLNVDHRITRDAVMTACRPLPGASVREILTFEVMSSTEWGGGAAPFLPNLFMDIGAHLETKMRALDAYKLEMRSFPHSRSLEHMRHLARHRGSSVGVEAAEAFMVVRLIR